MVLIIFRIDRIDRRKLENAFKFIGLPYDDELINAMLAQLDKSEKGYVTLPEFSELIKAQEVRFIVTLKHFSSAI